MTTAIIELDHLQKNFGKFAALKDVSFTLAPGQVLGFLGPNGAGKSTTIRVILGLLKKSGGSVTVFGKDACGMMRRFIHASPMFLGTFIYGQIFLAAKLSTYCYV